jgi:hypothetical protein
VTAPPGTPDCTVYRPDGKVLAVGGAPGYLSSRSLGGTVGLLDAANLALITSRSVPDLDAYSLTFTPDGRTLALVGHGQAAGGVGYCWTPPRFAPWPRPRCPAEPT